MSVVRADFVFGVVEGGGLGVGEDEFTSSALANLPPVAAPDIARIILNPGGPWGSQEIVHVTDHAADATVATVIRGALGTTERSHSSGAGWKHGPVAADWDELGVELDAAEITADFSTTGSAAEDVTGLSVTFVCPRVGPVYLKGDFHSIRNDTLGGGVFVSYTDPANTIVAGAHWRPVPSAACEVPFSRTRRLTGLTPGTTYTYKVRLQRTVSGIATIDAAGASPGLFVAMASAG